MYTEPQIVTNSDLKVKSYVTFYFNEERYRFYAGTAIGLKLFPNRATTQRERLVRLEQLRTALLKLLVADKFPYQPEVVEIVTPDKLELRVLLNKVLNNKLGMRLSAQYKTDLRIIHQQFTSFLNDTELSSALADLRLSRIEEFLRRFQSSGTYYMRRRSDLSILLNACYKEAGIPSLTSRIQTVRSRAVLHSIYNKEKMLQVLAFLKEVSPKLHLCCLMTYGCWLRPHVEIRMLKKRQFKNNNTEIHLSGSENKGGRVRVVYVPPYVQEVLAPLLDSISEDDNLFTKSKAVHGVDYFSTLWERVKPSMLEQNLISKNQTIYSFRHTAAVFLYRKTKDIYLLQKLLGHSSIGVTQKYLRGLGEVDLHELKNAAPEL